jgi:hypothetical protein
MFIVTMFVDMSRHQQRGPVEKDPEPRCGVLKR